MKDKSIVEKAVSYIENHLNEDLPLDMLAEKLHYSKFYLERAFAENMNCTVYQYIKRRRLTEAARELVETDKPIVDIALDAHYNSQQAFTLAFRQVYLCSPQVYRNNGVFSPKQEKVRMQQGVYGTFASYILCTAHKGGIAA